MWNSKKSVILSLVVCFATLAIIVVFMFFAPSVLRWYFLSFSDTETGADKLVSIMNYRTLLLCFYPSAVFAITALCSLIRLLLNIRRDEIFIEANVTALRVISWCCFTVAAITAAGGVYYMPLFFVAAAAGFIGLILRVVKNVMQSAVTLREENDLTI